MPTLLDKPPPVSSSAPSPVHVLHSRHRWERWRGVLIAVLIGLAATLAALAVLHPSWLPPTAWTILAPVWAGGLLLTGLAATVAWRFAPASLADTAQGMDRNLASKNRLEATAALHDSTTPLARAQRDETAAYLMREARARPVRLFPWLIAVVVALFAAHVSMLALWMLAPLLHPIAPASLPPLPKEPPRASITWIPPEPETEANPVQEVPTVALAQSTTGLANLTLEISVNGAPRKSVPLPAEPFGQPGKNILKVSLHMDELGVQPLDVVSYFLRGQRITDQNVLDTTSEIKFIQVRPFRDDERHATAQNKNVPADHKEDLNLLIQLKLAQLQSIKENFILAHTEIPATDPSRVRVNDRVGKTQGDLSAKAEQVVQTFVHDKLPAGAIDLLRQAEAPMNDASQKILAVQNVPAILSQEKALDLIVQAEKTFHKALADNPTPTPTPPPLPTPPKSPDDASRDKPPAEMKKRSETTAGQLTQLAQNQIKLSRNIDHNDPPVVPASAPAPAPAATDKPAAGNNPPGGQTNPAPAPGANPADAGKSAPQPADLFQPDPGYGTFSERQGRVLRGIQTLLNTTLVLPPAVNARLQDAAKHAADSIHQLDQANEADAREPAAAAATDLRQAVWEMTDAGGHDTRLALEQAQGQLNDVAQKLRDIAKTGPPGSQQPGLSDLASQVRDVRQQLGDAANQQQEAGSEAGARQLIQLADAIGSEHVAPDLDGMAQSGLDVNKAMAIAQTLEGLSAKAAQPPDPAGPSAEAIAALVNSLEASRENLARLADKVDATGPAQAQGAVPSDNSNPGAPDAATGTAEDKAYHEVMADVNDETQQAAAAIHGLDTTGVAAKVADLEDNHYRKTNGANVVRAYQALAPPLEKLISDLNIRLAQVQRENIVKPPDLDEAPAAYRAAVSDYFETLSRDYHPAAAGQDSPKP